MSLEQHEIYGSRGYRGRAAQPALRSAAERMAAGEQLVVTSNPQIRHVPRHPGQREGRLTSLCNQTVVFVLPDAPALRGRSPLPICAICERHLPR